MGLSIIAVTTAVTTLTSRDGNVDQINLHVQTTPPGSRSARENIAAAPRARKTFPLGRDPISRKLLFIIVIVIVSDPPLPHSTPRCFYRGEKGQTL